MKNNKEKSGERDVLLNSETWWAVYDQMTHKLLYLYRDQISAINQARRGTHKWVVVEVRCKFDPLEFARVNHCCAEDL